MADRIDPVSPSTSPVLESRVDPTSARFEANMRFFADLVSQVRNEEEKIREGGGAKAIESQHGKGRLTARERIHLLVDPGTFFELGAYAALRHVRRMGRRTRSRRGHRTGANSHSPGHDHRQ